MKFYGLYRITNLTNGKMYIGQHVTDNIDDGYMGSGIHIKRAVKKCGPENFRKEWLGFYEDKDELNYMERVFVDQTWMDRVDTYNLRLGGDGGPITEEAKEKVRQARLGTHHTEATKEKIRQARLGPKNPNFGKHLSEETREKIRQAHLGENNYQYGKHPTEETREKMRRAHLGKHFRNETKEKIRQSKLGKHWYTNGTENICAKECPEGFRPGRTRKNGVK